MTLATTKPLAATTASPATRSPSRFEPQLSALTPTSTPARPPATAADPHPAALWTTTENRHTRELHSDPPSDGGGGGGGARNPHQDQLATTITRRSPAKLPVLRIAVWQAALVLGFAATGLSLRGAIIAALAAALTLTLSAARIHGTWLSTVAARWLLLMLRRRTWEDHLPTITPTGVLVGAEGLTVVARTRELDLDLDNPDLDLQLVAHRGPRQAQPAIWLAITARRTADVPADEQLRVPLDNAIRRLRKSTTATLLSGNEIRSAIAGITHPGPSRESWRCWRSGPVTQISLRLTGLTGPDVIHRLLDEGRDTAVTVAVHPRTGTGVVRVAGTDPNATELAVRRIKNAPGACLERLDGRHGPAVLASLPIGGEL